MDAAMDVVGEVFVVMHDCDVVSVTQT